jgi:capsular polysaccharide biosynthesis protein
MQPNNNNDSGIGCFTIILIAVAIYAWNQISSLKKQVTELQAQTDVYSTCVAGLESNESTLNTAIDDAKRNLGYINTYQNVYTADSYLSSALRALNNTYLITPNCNIPDAPDVPTP